MTVDLADGLPYLLLWIAVALAAFRPGRRGWQLFTALSLAAAVAAGIVEWAGLVAIVVYAGACFAAVRPTLSTAARALSWAVVVLAAVALAAHQVPWIHNVLVFDAVAVSPASADYTLYWNYDKALAGLLLYAVCVQPQPRRAWHRVIVATAAIAVLTPLLIVVPATAMGFVAWDPKWPAILAMWVPANLLVTCLAEETFFRGLLQRRLAGALDGRAPRADLVALSVAAVAFGAAHFAGGVVYVMLAALAGVGYGAAYHLTQRVEASILVHFTLNLVHLVLFTYPFVLSG